MCRSRARYCSTNHSDKSPLIHDLWANWTPSVAAPPITRRRELHHSNSATSDQSTRAAEIIQRAGPILSPVRGATAITIGHCAARYAGSALGPAEFFGSRSPAEHPHQVVPSPVAQFQIAPLGHPSSGAAE